MIFVDTGGWYATAVPSDADHQRARRWMEANEEPLLTSDYVIDETLTLLVNRGHPGRARTFGEQIVAGTLADIYFLTEADFRDAWLTFQRFADKQWSFTDCTSKIVIEKLNIATAFSFDDDFRQFGTVIVVPPPR